MNTPDCMSIKTAVHLHLLSFVGFYFQFCVGAMKMNWTAKKRLLTLCYWIAITLLFLYDRSYLIQKIGLGHFVACTLVRVALLLALACFHLYYLVPQFFAERRYVIYFTSVLLSLAVYVSLQSVYDIYLYGFIIGAVNYRGFW